MSGLRFWVAILLLVVTGGILTLRGDKDRVPVSQPLASLPQSIGNWVGTDIPMQEYVLESLGKGVFLNRIYAGSQDPELQAVDLKKPGASIGLFIGYFPTQRTGQAIHSPQNCLPGAGWTFQSKGVVAVPDGHGGQTSVGDYLITNGANQDEVLYWYRSQGSDIASDYRAKWHTLTSSILYGRTDAALIRVITPIQSGEPRSSAQSRVVAFAGRLNRILPAYVPD